MNGLARWGWLLGFQEQGDGSQGAQVQNRKLPKQLLTHCGAELGGDCNILWVCITHSQTNLPKIPLSTGHGLWREKVQ